MIKNFVMPLDTIEVLDGELEMVLGGVSSMSDGASKGAGCDCGCKCSEGVGCGCKCGSGSGCGCGCKEGTTKTTTPAPIA